MTLAAEIMSHPVVWMIAFIVVLIVIFQAIVFIRLAKKVAPEVGLSDKEVKSVIRTGAISSLGPSFAIIIVAISLITLIGEPTTMMRIGIVGSAPIETVGASLGAAAAGEELGNPSFSAPAFTAAVWVMCLGGTGWLLVTALFTKSLGRIQHKLTSGGGGNSAKWLSVISTAALIGAFGYFGGGQMAKGMNETIVFTVALIAMPIIMWISNKLKLSWLREWSLGLIILIGMGTGYLLM
ncbi:MAG: DUF5058 family protein [Solibacillus sp.]